MSVIIQYERVDKGLFHVFAGGRHIGLVAKQMEGWFFRSNSGYFSPLRSSRSDAVKTWPDLTKYRLSEVVAL